MRPGWLDASFTEVAAIVRGLCFFFFSFPFLEGKAYVNKTRTKPGKRVLQVMSFADEGAQAEQEVDLLGRSEKMNTLLCFSDTI